MGFKMGIGETREMVGRLRVCTGRLLLAIVLAVGTAAVGAGILVVPSAPALADCTAAPAFGAWGSIA